MDKAIRKRRDKKDNKGRKDNKKRKAMEAVQMQEAAMAKIAIREPVIIDNVTSSENPTVVLSSNVLAEEMRSTCLDPAQKEKRSKFIE